MVRNAPPFALPSGYPRSKVVQNLAELVFTPFQDGINALYLWRIAIDHPGRPVPACIHRAPLTLPGQQSRLLLIR